MTTQTKATQDSLTPKDALQILVDGNSRFTASKREDRNYKEQVNQTSAGQFPLAVVLSCIDSRVPAEIVFDQGIGDIFSTRVAGNVINEDVLGSMEYSCKVAGSKLLVVMGHTKCGAVTAACKNVKLGNITALLNKISPAVDDVRTAEKMDAETEMNSDQIEKVAELNVEYSINRIRKESPILAEMETNGEIEIVGASYDVSTGTVTFL